MMNKDILQDREISMDDIKNSIQSTFLNFFHVVWSTDTEEQLVLLIRAGDQKSGENYGEGDDCAYQQFTRDEGRG